MSEQQTPQPGDLIRVTYEGRYGVQPSGLEYLSNPRVPDQPLFDGATVEVLERAECGASEGMSGIACQLPKGHVLPDGSLRTVHEGTTTAEQTKVAGYEIFVRWPVDGKTLPASPLEYPEVSGAGVPYPPEPRVFRSDGPEPPSDVHAVRDGSSSIPFLVRYGDHWRWARNLKHAEDHAYVGGSWEDANSRHTQPVTLVEVV